MLIDCDTFFDASFSCPVRELSISLYGRIVATISCVNIVTTETGRDAAGPQDLLFLRVETMVGACHVFFIDHEHGRTNVRQVSSRLTSLAQTLSWLLPPGHFARQGDVAFYTIDQVPSLAKECSLVRFEERLLPLIGGRHEICDAEACRFYTTDNRFFLSVPVIMRIVHSEHGPLLLSSGIYELKIAKGKSLPRGAYVMRARTFLTGL
jgi:hypothetical protein